MNSSSLVRKIEKARDYAEQRERVSFMQCRAEFRGDNGEHEVSYEAGNWQCNCNFYKGHDTCSHIMAMEMMLTGMMPEEAAATA